MSSLSLLLAIAAPVNAQERQNDRQDHPEQQQNRREQARPAAQHDQRQPAAHPQGQERTSAPERAKQRPENRAPQQQQHAQPQQRAQQQQHAQQQHAQKQPSNRVPRPPQRAQQQQHPAQHSQQGRDQRARGGRPTPQQQRVRQSAWQQHRARSWQSDHRTWQQRGGYRGYRVPEARYRGYFGPQHGFRIGVLPFMVVGGNPRFQYQGYWISAVDPWPETWANNWYETDDVYVTYVDNGYYMFNRRYPTSGIAISISL